MPWILAFLGLFTSIGLSRGGGDGTSETPSLAATTNVPEAQGIVEEQDVTEDNVTEDTDTQNEDEGGTNAAEQVDTEPDPVAQPSGRHWHEDHWNDDAEGGNDDYVAFTPEMPQVLEEEPEAGTGSDPVVQPMPEPVIDPEPQAAADPEPQPEPQAAAEPEPQPEPQAAADPEPQPEPQAAADPEPQPEPQAAADPEPVSQPEETPTPVASAAAQVPFDDSILAQADFFVATYGSDSARGTMDDPLASIDRAVALAKPGDTILVRGGVYEGTVSISQGGEEGAPLTIMGYPGERPVIDGSGTGSNTDLVSITDSYVRFEGFEIMDATRSGISVWSSHDVTLANNVIHDTERGGIWIGSDRLGVSYGHVVEGNDVYNTVLENEATSWSSGWARAIAIDVSTDTVVRDNVVFKNYGEGIGGLSSSNVQYFDNILYDNFSVQMYFDNTQNITAEGNIFFHTGDEDFYRGGEPAPGIVIANENTSFQMATIGMMVSNNTFAGVEPVYYDGSYGWGGGISNSNLGPNTVLSANEVDPAWLEEEENLFI